MNPLLSVIIPTHKRPDQLKRAILSALESTKTESAIEVIVVPNGNDDSWKRVQDQFLPDERIRWSYIPTGQACAARNHGLSIARGKYVRFLDDDDFLYTSAAEQLEALDSSDALASSAPLERVSPEGESRGTTYIPQTEDYTSAALLSLDVSMAQGSIFLRSAITNAKWREDTTLYDDYIWMLDVTKKIEGRWIKFNLPVAAYVDHFNERLSHSRRSGASSRHVVESILELHRQLDETGQINHQRSHAIATALLTFAHSTFPASPIYLSKVIQQAKRLDRTAMPRHEMFSSHPWLARHLLPLEWGTLVPRYLSRGFRRLTWRVKRVLPTRTRH